MRRLIKGAAAFCFGTAIAITTAYSQPGPFVSVDEYGHIYINGTASTPGVRAVEPFSGLTTLRYTLPWQVVSGDAVLTEQGTNTVSDVIRFENDPIGGTGLIYFFSDSDDTPDPLNLADGPLPTTPILPSITTPEQQSGNLNGWFGYAPGNNLPGGSSIFPGVKYDLISDGIPEPGSFALLALGGLVVGARVRARR